MKTLKEQVIEKLIAAGVNGLTSDEIVEITGQSNNKLARQLVRKARWTLYEMGYRLAKDIERLEGGFVVYRAIRVDAGKNAELSNREIQNKHEVEFYNIKQSA